MRTLKFPDKIKLVVGEFLKYPQTTSQFFLSSKALKKKQFCIFNPRQLILIAHDYHQQRNQSLDLKIYVWHFSSAMRSFS